MHRTPGPLLTRARLSHDSLCTRRRDVVPPMQPPAALGHGRSLYVRRPATYLSRVRRRDDIHILLRPEEAPRLRLGYVDTTSVDSGRGVTDPRPNGSETWLSESNGGGRGRETGPVHELLMR